MKCKDIPDELFMTAVTATPPMTPGGCWRHRRDVQARLEQMLGAPLPEKLFLAKARKLGAKRRLEGCTRCTCRGDYHTPRECRVHRCCYDPGFDWRTHPEYAPEWEADEQPARGPEVLAEAVTGLTGLFPLPLAPALRPFDLGAAAVLLALTPRRPDHRCFIGTANPDAPP